MEIATSYVHLRQTADRIMDLVSHISGLDRNEIGISSAINKDLGVNGDDWVELQQALEKKEGLSLEGLQFYDYFMDETQIAYSGEVVIAIVQFLWYAVSFKWLWMTFDDYYIHCAAQKEALTIADLITSKYEGRFTKHADRKFIFL